MIHDGSGGMLIDPALWIKKPIDYGPILDSWQRGDWKWNLVGLGVGDPVYILVTAYLGTLTTSKLGAAMRR